MLLCLLVSLFCFVTIHGQDKPKLPTLHNGLTEKIGNFSVELLYHTAKASDNNLNLILSPITVWTAMAVIAEGASGDTLTQIKNIIRTSNKTVTRAEFADIMPWLVVNTPTIELQKINALFVNSENTLETDFQLNSLKYYMTETIALNFSNADLVANVVNNLISNITHGKITNLVDSRNFNAEMILTSALYFRGQWSTPFNKSLTARSPFFDSNGTQIGEVNMMYNRRNYPFTNIQELQARIIELPYGVENRLSMLIMMPNPGVSLENMFLNLGKVILDKIFRELKIAQEEYGEDEVDCFIPRFKIESDLDLTTVFKEKLGVVDLFDEKLAKLPRMARHPLYVTTIKHKAEIEVTEEGTEAAGVTQVEFGNRIGAIRFEANRPFTYLIIEKVTNSIVFGGFYKTPSLY